MTSLKIANHIFYPSYRLRVLLKIDKLNHSTSVITIIYSIVSLSITIIHLLPYLTTILFNPILQTLLYLIDSTNLFIVEQLDDS